VAMSRDRSSKALSSAAQMVHSAPREKAPSRRRAGAPRSSWRGTLGCGGQRWNKVKRMCNQGEFIHIGIQGP
jgi:hypothetical protein